MENYGLSKNLCNMRKKSKKKSKLFLPIMSYFIYISCIFDLIDRIIHLDCFYFLSQLPVLENINEQVLLKICDSLKPVYYNEKSYIVREGDPIDETVFITDGIAWSYTTKNDEASVSSLAERLGKGHFFGELLEFVLKNPSLPKLPVSTRTVKTHGSIEAFTLKAEELKNIVCKNWMCVGEGQSEPFAANVVQAAWRRYHESKKS